MKGSCISCYQSVTPVSEIQLSCFNAENHIFAYTSLVFDLEFEGHTVGMWRRNLVPENWYHGAAIRVW